MYRYIITSKGRAMFKLVQENQVDSSLLECYALCEKGLLNRNKELFDQGINSCKGVGSLVRTLFTLIGERPLTREGDENYLFMMKSLREKQPGIGRLVWLD